MADSSVNYEDLLYQINTGKKQDNKTYQIPEGEEVFYVDLNSRKIEAPKFLSVQYDHNSETIYFKCDRYFDGVDLARDDITILIQYENADPNEKKKGYLYVPLYKDTKTFKLDNQIAFPWVIEGAATAYSGKVSFSIKFYKTVLSDDNSEDSQVKKYEYHFNLNTLASTSEVLHGMDAIKETENYIYDVPTVIDIYSRISQLEAGFDLFWEVL